MIKAYTAFAYYGTTEIVKDILDFIRNNPAHLDFDQLIDLSYNNFTKQSYICVGIEVSDYTTLKDFVTLAEILHQEIN